MLSVKVAETVAAEEELLATVIVVVPAATPRAPMSAPVAPSALVTTEDEVTVAVDVEEDDTKTVAEGMLIPAESLASTVRIWVSVTPTARYAFLVVNAYEATEP
jgi:hypothetical protein